MQAKKDFLLCLSNVVFSQQIKKTYTFQISPLPEEKSDRQEQNAFNYTKTCQKLWYPLTQYFVQYVHYAMSTNSTANVFRGESASQILPLYTWYQVHFSVAIFLSTPSPT